MAAKRFGVGMSTAIDWVRRFRETGSAVPGQTAGKSRGRLRETTGSRPKSAKTTSAKPDMNGPKTIPALAGVFAGGDFATAGSRGGSEQNSTIFQPSGQLL